MWVLIYLLIYLVPVAFIVLAFALIGGAAARIYRNGKRSFKEVKPLVDKLASDAQRAQQRGMSFADRGQKMAEAVDEISGRWAFIVEEFTEAQKSPVVRLAGVAGKFMGDRSRNK
jgi:hypothetical protein